MASSNGYFPANLPTLDGKNYDNWCRQLKVILGFQDVWELVTNVVEKIGDDATEAQNSVHKVLKKKDCKTQFILHQCVETANIEKIGLASSTKEAWEILQKAYAGAYKLKKVRLQTLRRQYELL